MRRKLGIAALTFAVIGCGGAYWLHHLRMNARPERIYPNYASELDEFAQRLESGDVRHEPGRGYAIPQFLIDKGAKSVTKHGRCYAVWFTSMLDNPTPVLWYSLDGLDPIPPELARVVSEPRSQWSQLSPNWGYCYLPWWLNP